MSSFSPFLLFLNFLLIFDSAFPSEEESSIAKSPQKKGDEGEMMGEFDGAGCGMTKGCLMKPKDCTPGKDCVYAMSYVADDERIYFELLAQVSAERNSYVALGFSVDGLMGGDTVTDCSSFEGAPFSGRLSYNPGKSNRKVPLEADKEAQILTTHLAKYADGTLYCRFSHLIQPPASVQPQFVRPLNSPIFILMSTGTTRNQELAIHSLNADSPLFPFSSTTPIQLTEYKIGPGSGWPNKGNSNSSAAFVNNSPSTTISTPLAQMDKVIQELETDSSNGSLTQQKLHGVLMLLSWLLLAPFAILSARFLHHEQIELLGLHLWFQIHRAANSLAFFLVLISLLFILASLNSEWIGPSPSRGYEENISVRSLHAFFGAAAIFLTLCQPINALFRCAPNSPARFIFGWLHSIFGYSAWLFSAVSICIACFFFNNKFLDWFVARDLLIASLALIIVSFSVLQWFSYRRRKCQLANAANTISIGIGGKMGGGEMANERQKEGLLIQRAIVGLFLAVASILCLALSILLILA